MHALVSFIIEKNALDKRMNKMTNIIDFVFSQSDLKNQL